jgi:hypothetical protein
MTLVNSWNGGSHSDETVCLQCDLCFPPRVSFLTAGDLEASGWRVESVDKGPHVCEVCVRRRERRPHVRQETQRFVNVRTGRGGALPNLLVIGAPKCGTTSLHYYLGLHPEVYMSAPKELNFFQDPNCLDKLDLYASLFDQRSPVRGESTANYSRHPMIAGIPERISAALPDVKLIYVVREPVERAVAHYVEAVTTGSERRTFEQAFGDLDDPYNLYLATSRYASQIERFLECFSPDDLLVVDQADLRSRRAETLQRMFRFVGVDDSFATQDFDRTLNTTGDKRSMRAAGRWLRQTAPARAVVRLPPRFREPLLRPVRRLLSDPVQVPSPGSSLRRRLVHALEDEVSRLREMTGESFAGWSDFEAGAPQRRDRAAAERHQPVAR